MDLRRKKFFIFRASLACGLILSFFINDIAHAAGAPIKTFQRLKIPQALGRVDESFAGKNPKTIFYIQDAHDSLEAQQNIAKLIRRFVRKENIKTVYEEGYEGPVPTDQFFGFIKNPAIREKAAYFLMEKLRLSGAEYAHITRSSVIPAKAGIQVLPAINSPAGRVRRRFSGGDPPVKPGDDKRVGDFKLIGADSIPLHLKNIRKCRSFFRHQEQTKKDLEALSREIRLLADQAFPNKFKSWLKLQERYESGQLDVLEYIKRTAATVGAGFKPAPTIDAGVIFQEINNLENAVVAKYLKSEMEFQIFRYQKQIRLLKRLSEMEITAAEYEAVKTILKKINTQEIADFVARQAHKPVLLSRRWELAIRRAMEFYEIAHERNQAIAKALDDFIANPEEEQAVLVFGGFHREAIRQLLESKNLSYHILSPHMSGADPVRQEYYKRLMTSGYHAFEIPLMVKTAARPEAILEMELKPTEIYRHQLERWVTEFAHLPNELLVREVSKKIGEEITGGEINATGAAAATSLRGNDQLAPSHQGKQQLEVLSQAAHSSDSSSLVFLGHISMPKRNNNKSSIQPAKRMVNPRKIWVVKAAVKVKLKEFINVFAANVLRVWLKKLGFGFLGMAIAYHRSYLKSIKISLNLIYPNKPLALRSEVRGRISGWYSRIRPFEKKLHKKLGVRLFRSLPIVLRMEEVYSGKKIENSLRYTIRNAYGLEKCFLAGVLFLGAFMSIATLFFWGESGWAFRTIDLFLAFLFPLGLGYTAMMHRYHRAKATALLEKFQQRKIDRPRSDSKKKILPVRYVYLQDVPEEELDKVKAQMVALYQDVFGEKAAGIDSLLFHFDDYWRSPLSVIAQSDDEEQSMVGVAMVQSWGPLDEVLIDYVVVGNAYRRQKIATQMLQRIAIQAEKRNITSLKLRVVENNESAIRLYQSLGFEEFGERKRSIAATGEPVTFMSMEAIPQTIHLRATEILQRSRSEARSYDFQDRLGKVLGKSQRLIRMRDGVENFNYEETLKFVKSILRLKGTLRELEKEARRNNYHESLRNIREMQQELSNAGWSFYFELWDKEFWINIFLLIFGLRAGHSAGVWLYGMPADSSKLSPQEFWGTVIGFLVMVLATGIRNTANVLKARSYNFVLDDNKVIPVPVKTVEIEIDKPPVKKYSFNKQIQEALINKLGNILADINADLGVESQPHASRLPESVRTLPLFSDEIYLRLSLIMDAMVEYRPVLKDKSFRILRIIDKDILTPLQEFSHPWVLAMPRIYDWLMYPALYYMQDETYERRVMNYLEYLDDAMKYAGATRDAAEQSLFTRFAWYAVHFRNDNDKKADHKDHKLYGEFLRRIIPILERRLQENPEAARPFAAAFLNGLLFSPDTAVKMSGNRNAVQYFDEYLLPAVEPDQHERFRNVLRSTIELLGHDEALPAFLRFHAFKVTDKNLFAVVSYNQDAKQPVSQWDILSGNQNAQPFLEKMLDRNPSFNDFPNLQQLLDSHEDLGFHRRIQLSSEQIHQEVVTEIWHALRDWATTGRLPQIRSEARSLMDWLGKGPREARETVRLQNLLYNTSRDVIRTARVHQTKMSDQVLVEQFYQDLRQVSQKAPRPSQEWQALMGLLEKFYSGEGQNLVSIKDRAVKLLIKAYLWRDVYEKGSAFDQIVNVEFDRRAMLRAGGGLFVRFALSGPIRAANEAEKMVRQELEKARKLLEELTEGLSIGAHINLDATVIHDATLGLPLRNLMLALSHNIARSGTYNSLRDSMIRDFLEKIKQNSLLAAQLWQQHKTLLGADAKRNWPQISFFKNLTPEISEHGQTDIQVPAEWQGFWRNTKTKLTAAFRKDMAPWLLQEMRRAAPFRLKEYLPSDASDPIQRRLFAQRNREYLQEREKELKEELNELDQERLAQMDERIWGHWQPSLSESEKKFYEHSMTRYLEIMAQLEENQKQQQEAKALFELLTEGETFDILGDTLPDAPRSEARMVSLFSLQEEFDELADNSRYEKKGNHLFLRDKQAAILLEGTRTIFRIPTQPGWIFKIPVDVTQNEAILHEARVLRELQSKGFVDGIPLLVRLGAMQNGGVWLELHGVERGRDLNAYLFGSLHEFFEVMLRAARVLKSVHDKGIVHADVKTDNFLINPKKQIQLNDFDGAVPIESPRFSTHRPTVFTSDLERQEGFKINLGLDTDTYSFILVLTELIEEQMKLTREPNVRALLKKMRDRYLEMIFSKWKYITVQEMLLARRWQDTNTKLPFTERPRQEWPSDLSPIIEQLETDYQQLIPGASRSEVRSPVKEDLHWFTEAGGRDLQIDEDIFVEPAGKTLWPSPKHTADLQKIGEITESAKDKVQPRGDDENPGGFYLPSSPTRMIRAFEIAGLRPGQKVMDLGHGTGDVLFLAAHFFKAKGLGAEWSSFLFRKSIAARDALVEEDMIAEDQAELRSGDFNQLSFKDADYLFYYSHGSSSESIDFKKVIEEMKPGAKFLVLGVRDEDFDHHKATHRYQNFAPLLASGKFDWHRDQSAGVWIFTKRAEVRNVMNMLADGKLTYLDSGAFTHVFTHPGLSGKVILIKRSPQIIKGIPKIEIPMQNEAAEWAMYQRLDRIHATAKTQKIGKISPQRIKMEEITITKNNKQWVEILKSDLQNFGETLSVYVKELGRPLNKLEKSLFLSKEENIMRGLIVRTHQMWQAGLIDFDPRFQNYMLPLNANGELPEIQENPNVLTHDFGGVFQLPESKADAAILVFLQTTMPGADIPNGVALISSFAYDRDLKFGQRLFPDVEFDKLFAILDEMDGAIKSIKGAKAEKAAYLEILHRPENHALFKIAMEAMAKTIASHRSGRSELRNMEQKQIFIQLLHLLNRNWWLFESDKSFLGFNGNSPNEVVVMEWNESELAVKKQAVAEMISHRFAIGKLDDMRQAYPQDEEKLYELLGKLGMTIDTSRPEDWNHTDVDLQRLRAALPKALQLVLEGYTTRSLFADHLSGSDAQASQMKKFVTSWVSEYGLIPSEPTLRLVHEMVFNVSKHALNGAFGIRRVEKNGQAFFEIAAWDSGRGMAWPEQLRRANVDRPLLEGWGFFRFNDFSGEIIIESLGKKWVKNGRRHPFREQGESSVTSGQGTKITIRIAESGFFRSEVRQPASNSLAGGETEGSSLPVRQAGAKKAAAEAREEMNLSSFGSGDGDIHINVADGGKRHAVAGVEDLETKNFPRLIDIRNNTFLYFNRRLDALARLELNIQSINFGVIFYLHTILNLLRMFLPKSSYQDNFFRFLDGHDYQNFTMKFLVRQIAISVARFGMIGMFEGGFNLLLRNASLSQAFQDMVRILKHEPHDTASSREVKAVGGRSEVRQPASNSLAGGETEGSSLPVRQAGAKKAAAEVRNRFNKMLRKMINKIPEEIRDEDLRFELYSQLEDSDRERARVLILESTGRNLDKQRAPASLDAMVAFYDSRPIATFLFHEMSKTEVYGHKIYVEKPFRGKGIGARLRERVFSETKRRGFTHLHASISHTPEAQDFHRSFKVQPGVTVHEDREHTDSSGRPLLHAVTIDLHQFNPHFRRSEIREIGAEDLKGWIDEIGELLVQENAEESLKRLVSEIENKLKTDERDFFQEVWRKFVHYVNEIIPRMIKTKISENDQTWIHAFLAIATAILSSKAPDLKDLRLLDEMIQTWNRKDVPQQWNFSLTVFLQMATNHAATGSKLTAMMRLAGRGIQLPEEYKYRMAAFTLFLLGMHTQTSNLASGGYDEISVDFNPKRSLKLALETIQTGQLDPEAPAELHDELMIGLKIGLVHFLFGSSRIWPVPSWNHLSDQGRRDILREAFRKKIGPLQDFIADNRELLAKTVREIDALSQASGLSYSGAGIPWIFENFLKSRKLQKNPPATWDQILLNGFRADYLPWFLEFMTGDYSMESAKAQTRFVYRDRSQREYARLAHQIETFQPVRSEARTALDFLEILKTEFPNQKKLRVLDIGTGSGDFPLELKQLFDKAGFQNEIVAVDREIDNETKQDLNQAGVRYEQENIDMESDNSILDEPFDIIFLNSPVISMSRRMLDIFDKKMQPGAMVIWRFSSGESLGSMRRNLLLRNLKTNQHPFAILDHEPENLPAGSEIFSATFPPIFVRKKGTQFFYADLHSLATQNQHPRSEVRKKPLRKVSSEEKFAKASLALVRKIHAGVKRKEIDSILMSGGSVFLTYALLTTAWRSLYGDEPLPTIYALSGKTNRMLYPRFDALESHAQTEAKIGLEIRKTKETEILDAIHRDLAQAGKAFEDLKKSRVLYLDEAMFQGIKLRGLEIQFERLGFKNPVQFATFTDGSRGVPLKKLSGSVSFETNYSLRNLAKDISTGIEIKGEHYWAMAFHDGNINVFESLLEPPYRKIIEAIEQKIRTLARRSEVRITSNKIFENKRIFVDFGELVKNFSEEQIKEIMFTAQQAQRNVQVLVYGLDRTLDSGMAKLLESQESDHFKVETLTLSEMAKKYAKDFKGEIIHLSSGKSGMQASLLKDQFKAVTDIRQFYAAAYEDQKAGTLGALLRDLGNSGYAIKAQADLLNQLSYYMEDANGHLAISDRAAAGLDALSRLYDRTLAFSRAA